MADAFFDNKGVGANGDANCDQAGKAGASAAPTMSARKKYVRAV
ncbi:MAG: hypothetical protein WB821_15095 [Burkholderiaceae bacterium]